MPSVLIISGPAGVGKSTLTWEISTRLRAAGVAHVCLDSDELDRVHPLSSADQERLGRANLAAFWANAATFGHTRLVLAGVFLDLDLNLAWIRAAIPGATVTAVRLDATDDALSERLQVREIGSGLDRQLARTVAMARLFRHRPDDGRIVVDTTGRTIGDIAVDVLAAAGWEGATAPPAPAPASGPVEVVVRPYEGDDVDAGRRLWFELTDHHRRLFDEPTIGGDDPGAHFDVSLATPERVATWVAVLDGDIVGLTGLFDHGAHGELEPEIVTERLRSRGIGRRLVEEVVAESRRRGHDYLAVRPVARNTAAIARFHAAGFRTLGAHVDLTMDLRLRDRILLGGTSLHGLDFRY